MTNGDKIRSMTDTDDPDDLTKYCPYCGAKMRCDNEQK